LATGVQSDNPTPFWRRLLTGLLVGAITFSPVVVGIVSIHSVFFPIAAGLSLVVAALAAWLPGSTARCARPLGRVVLVIAVMAVTATGFDLLARPLAAPLLYYRPHDRYVNRWPRLPLLSRYRPNVVFEGPTYGDLAAMSGDRDAREVRTIRFQTDAYGFRNVESDPADIDVIVLGDSFGAGVGTTQEATWASLLAGRYGLSVYNLSMLGTNSWHQYTNLAVEIDRMNVHKGTVVIWAMFGGNDLEPPYYTDMLTPEDLPWNDPLSAAVVSFQTFRYRSPVRQSIERASRAVTGSEVPTLSAEFIDGSKVLFFTPYVRRKGRPQEQIQAGESYRQLEATVAAMGDLAADNGLTVAIVNVPAKAEVYSWVLDGGPPWSADPSPSGYSLAIQEIANAEGMCFLDLEPALIEASRRVYEESGELLWWRDDSHWNARGHEVVAAAVYEGLCLGADGAGCCGR
jgi:lysophospholipase L1-like esterase